MFEALYIGATGMQAQQLHVDTIANNLANVATTGYKRGRVSFTDLMVSEASRLPQHGDVNDVGILGGPARRNAGVGVSSLFKSFDMGDLKKTESAFDIAIEGDGFMEVTMPDGSRAFSRGGTLKVTSDGLLATQNGYPLKPNITIPENTQTLIIGGDGKVSVRTGTQSGLVQVGQLEMIRFSNPQGLLAQGDNLYRPSDASGEPIEMRVGDANMGRFAQGFLEGSNVKMVDEVVNLMVAQRAYEASVKVLQASDEMLGMINNLRR